MLERIKFEEEFDKIYQKEKRKIVVYGVGNGYRELASFLPKADYLCDINAKSIGEIDGQKVYEPEMLKKISEKLYILVCVVSAKTFDEICVQLDAYGIDAKIVHAFNNLSFGHTYTRTAKSYQVNELKRKMKVNIVCQEQTWIYKKFADKLLDYQTEEIEMMISTTTRDDVDLNHHIPCLNFKPYSNDTLMIAHIDDDKKVQILKKQLEVASLGICMSKDTVNKLVGYGIPRKKLCYINPAHDAVIKPKKYTIGITHRCYDNYDLRKRTTAILDILEAVESKYFRFMIMGSGWDEIVEKMREKDFEVIYYNSFIYEKYVILMQEIDYYLFIGMDEGSMGYVDAMAAGAKTIVTPQGFHLDTNCNIDYPCVTVKQFRDAFLDLQNQRQRRCDAVAEWTWGNYARKHIEIWSYILKQKSLKEIYHNQMMYEDGIFSVLLEDCRLEVY